jgi:hypothetical protein
MERQTNKQTNKQYGKTTSRYSQFCERAKKQQNFSAEKVYQF